MKDEENKKRSMDYDHQIQGLFNELQENIKAVSKKNEEIENFRRKLIEENSAVINSALYLKSIYDEIENERNMFIEEKEKLFQQKSAYLEVDLKQREKLNLLNAKELELLKWNEELIDKERLFTLKQRRLSLVEFKRTETSPGSLIKSYSGIE